MIWQGALSVTKVQYYRRPRYRLNGSDSAYRLKLGDLIRRLAKPRLTAQM